MNWTDDFSFFLSPLQEDVTSASDRESNQLGAQVIKHLPGQWPDLDNAQLVLLGVDDAPSRKGAAFGPDEVRRQLYRLYAHHQLRFVDIGNIKPGQSSYDTHIALKKVLGGMALRNTMVIIVGGKQHLTYSTYAAYEALESTVNIAVADAQIDIGEFNGHITSSNYLSQIVVHKPSYLFNLSVLGYQTYLNDRETLALMDKLYFDALRLGEIKKDPRIMEPHLRQADIVSIDINAVQNASAPGTNQPNGFSGEEVCQLARYAGLSDNCSSLGIYNYDPSNDPSRQSAQLIAQMIWHAIDGLASRIKEYPLMSKPDFFEYKVQLSNSTEHITFFKSKRSEKWWMNVPYSTPADVDLLRHHLVPCTYSDYETAAKGEIPDLWWRTYRKLT